MKMSECICEHCGVVFKKEDKEIRRKNRKGTPFYCSQSCSSKARDMEHLSVYIGKYTENLKPKVMDEYSIVRAHLARARRRNHVKGEMDLTLEYLLELWNSQKGICPISGITMKPVYQEGKIRRHSESYQSDAASLDRIDCSKGYVQGNVRFITAMANFARNCWDDQTLIDFCKKVASHNP